MSESSTNREHKEWCLLQQEKLRAEKAAFASRLSEWKEALKTIHSTLDEEAGRKGGGKSQELSEPCGLYKELWSDSWKGSNNLDRDEDTIDSTLNHGEISWFLDKRTTLRRELEHHVKDEIPTMYKALVDSSESKSFKKIFHEIDSAWRESWKQSLAMVTPKK